MICHANNNQKEIVTTTLISEKADFRTRNTTMDKEINYISVVDIDTEHYNKNLLIIPAYASKGLEFDSVIIINNVNGFICKENEISIGIVKAASLSDSEYNNYRNEAIKLGESYSSENMAYRWSEILK